MSFHPILIKDVLIIYKEELEYIALKQEYKRLFTDDKHVTEFQEAFVTYNTTLDYTNKYLGKEDDLYVGLSLRSDKQIDFNGNITFYVKSANYSVKCPYMIKFSNRHQKWYNTLCKLSNVLNPKNNLIADGKLTLHVQGIIFIQQTCNKNESALGKFLWPRVDDRDFIIVVGNDDEDKTEIKIHKCVLACRSPVFDAMLNSGMKESIENRMEIIDFEVEVVQAAVEYFYDRDILLTLDFDHLIGLLHFVDKYDIDDAKDKIQSVLLLHIYPDTICQIANASITSNTPTLKEACLKTLNLYILEKVPFNNADILDKDFAAELIQRISMPDEKEDSSSDDDISMDG